MTKEENEKLLASFKRSNKARRLVLTLKAGYSTVEDYLDYLIKCVSEENIKVNKTLKKNKKGKSLK